MYFLNKKILLIYLSSQFDPYHHVKLRKDDKKKLGIPTLEKVAEIFLAIKPDFPIPAKTILPLQFKIKSTALAKEFQI